MPSSEVDAVVVGSGPNGLAAALVLSKAGLQVELHEAAPTLGGGARTAELTLPGFRHDVCSATHPMALASPFFRAFDLAGHGVQLLQPEIAYAHPLDGGRAGLGWRDLDRTADGLGRDGATWRSLLAPLVEHWHGLAEAAMSDLRRIPADLTTTIRFGLRMLEQGSPLWGARFRDDVAPALLTGVSAHASRPPRLPAPAGVGLLLATLAHAVGWPLPRGGSQAIVDAMAAELGRHGGRAVTGHRVETLSQLPRARAVLLDVAPAGLLRIAGDELPSRYARWLRGFRHGGAACKVDFALTGPVPWASPGCARAGTLHLVGTRPEALAAEREVAAGRHPQRPYVLAVQPGDAASAPLGSLHHPLGWRLPVLGLDPAGARRARDGRCARRPAGLAAARHSHRPTGARERQRRDRIRHGYRADGPAASAAVRATIRELDQEARWVCWMARQRW
jgi:phytoene dehydrogenase-like protein